MLNNDQNLRERIEKKLPVLRELVADLERLEEGFELEKTTEEERNWYIHMRNMFHSELADAGWRIRQLRAPVAVQGRLYKNTADRYQIEGKRAYFTCGASCEAYLPFRDWQMDEGEDPYMTWIPTGIEHKNGDYYFTARDEVPMAGALVRIRAYD